MSVRLNWEKRALKEFGFMLTHSDGLYDAGIVIDAGDRRERPG